MPMNAVNIREEAFAAKLCTTNNGAQYVFTAPLMTVSAWSMVMVAR